MKRLIYLKLICFLYSGCLKNNKVPSSSSMNDGKSEKAEFKNKEYCINEAENFEYYICDITDDENGIYKRDKKHYILSY